MDKTTENSLREKQLHANGRLLSSFSHELKNHLAVINESTGLLQDYVSMGRITEERLCTRLEKIVAQLNKRSAKIANMAHHLNCFSHRFDSPVAPFDLNQLLEELLFFLQRRSQLKGISLIFEKNESSLMCVNFPSLLQFIFLQLFEKAMTLLGEGDELRIITGKETTRVSLDLYLLSQSPLVIFTETDLNSAEITLSKEKTGAMITSESSESQSLKLQMTCPDIRHGESKTG